MNTTEKTGNPLAELDNMYKLLDMHIEEARPEYSRVTMPITQKVKNGMGIAHGGAIFTLADIAFGAACNSDARTGVVSLSTSIQFLAPGREGPLLPLSVNLSLENPCPRTRGAACRRGASRPGRETRCHLRRRREGRRGRPRGPLHGTGLQNRFSLREEGVNQALASRGLTGY